MRHPAVRLFAAAALVTAGLLLLTLAARDGRLMRGLSMDTVSPAKDMADVVRDAVPGFEVKDGGAPGKPGSRKLGAVEGDPLGSLTAKRSPDVEVAVAAAVRDGRFAEAVKLVEPPLRAAKDDAARAYLQGWKASLQRLAGLPAAVTKGLAGGPGIACAKLSLQPAEGAVKAAEEAGVVIFLKKAQLVQPWKTLSWPAYEILVKAACGADAAVTLALLGLERDRGEGDRSALAVGDFAAYAQARMAAGQAQEARRRLGAVRDLAAAGKPREAADLATGIDLAALDDAERAEVSAVLAAATADPGAQETIASVAAGERASSRTQGSGPAAGSTEPSGPPRRRSAHDTTRTPSSASLFSPRTAGKASRRPRS